MEQDAIIIKLTPHQGDAVQAVSFDEAFGAHSELGGRGKARRAARKAKRAEKKKTKGNRLGRAALAIATGGLVGGVIKTGPQARADRQAKRLERISRRREAQAARQSARAAQQEARQTRKDVRKTRRVARKELQVEEPDYEDTQYDEQEYYDEDPYAGEEYYEEDPYAGEEYYEEDPYAGEEYYEEDPYAGEEYYEEDPYAEQEYYEEDPYAEQEYYGGADGEVQESFEGEFAPSAEGMPEIHSEIRGIAEKIVWNKEAMRRRKGEKDKVISATKVLAKTNRNGRDVSKNSAIIQGHDALIQKHEARIKELESGLKKFGDHPHIAEGYRQAQSKLQKGLEKKVQARDKAVIKETLVASSLQPEISAQRIEVPSTPGMKTVEMTSGFTGPAVLKSLSTQTKVLLGIAALGIAYAVAKKYKYI